MKSNPLRYSLTTRFKDRHILDLLKFLDGKRVLDIGCGIGYMSSILSENGGEVYGIEVDLKALEYCVREAQGAFFCASADSIPFKDDYFDCILMADVIEHLPLPSDSLEEIVRVGKRDSIVVISTPHLSGWLTGTWVSSLMHGENDGFMTDHREGYTKEGLSNLMAKANIIPEKIRVTNPLISQIMIGIIKLGYMRTNGQYDSQTELLSVSSRWMYKVYKSLVFPIVYWLGRFEEALFGAIIPGHCLIISGRIKKT